MNENDELQLPKQVVSDCDYCGNITLVCGDWAGGKICNQCERDAENKRTDAADKASSIRYGF